MKKKFLSAVALALVSAFFLATAACSANRLPDERELSAQEYSILNTVGRDSLGRYSAPSDSVKKDKDRYVGLFYFLIHNNAADMQGIYDVTEILEKYGREGFNTDSGFSPSGKCHVWGEPVWGYYSTPDEWVMRKQIEMFVFSGIDFLVLDCSNGPLFEEATDVLFELIAEYRAAGWPAPQIVYQLNGGGVMERDIQQLKTIYNRYYTDEQFDSVWFAPEGRPMVICLEKTQVYLEGENAAEEEKMLSQFFHIKNSYWPTDSYFTNNSVPWMDFNIDPNVMGGWVSVSVAQHTTSMMSDTEGARGRGWTLLGGNDHENFAAGANLDHQWDNAIAKDSEVEYVFVTGWNEWGAQKMYRPDMDPVNGYVMIDQFNDEYSRDLEPTYSSGMKDNFYLQNMRRIREWKYESPVQYQIPAASPASVDDRAWSDAATYLDFTGEAIQRNAHRFDGAYSGIYLTDDTARNDIASVDVARDGENLYFRITVSGEVIIPYSEGDTSWMNIHIRTDAAENDAWGYNFVIRENGRVMAAENGTYTEKGKADTSVLGNQMYVRVPLSVLGLSENKCNIEFKVSDHVTDPGDVLSFYNSGDSAPIGGLSWSFGY